MLIDGAFLVCQTLAGKLCLPSQLAHAHRTWLSSSYREISRWCAPALLDRPVRDVLSERSPSVLGYSLKVPFDTFKLLYVELIYRKKPWWASNFGHLLCQHVHVCFLNFFFSDYWSNNTAREEPGLAQCLAQGQCSANLGLNENKNPQKSLTILAV